MKSFRADILHADDMRKSKRRNWWLLFLLGIILVFGSALFAGERYVFIDQPPLPKDLKTLWSVGKQPSYILLDKNGDVMSRRGPHYSQALPAKEMPEYLVQAFIAIEDQRFYQHEGIDEKGIFRALWNNWQAGYTVQGGSTITQQLVKVLLLSPDQNIKRKLQEMRLAKELETRLNKDQILTLYLNRIYLGNRAYGVVAAADRYFGKQVNDLSLAEAAMLAALPKAPSKFAPHQNLKKAQDRAALVLQAMVKTGAITEQQQQAATLSPATVIINEKELDHGYIFDFAIKQSLKLTGGRIPDLVIQTTIDPNMQEIAESKLRSLIAQNRELKKVTEGALLSVDSKGAVRALVGGVSYKRSNFNRVTSARRQPGSAFKAFVYAGALETGIFMNSIRRDEPIEIAGWAPENYNGNYRGRVTIHEAFRRSINTVAAQITEEIGAAKVVEIANRFGFNSQLKPLPSIALGAQEVSLWELTQAFSVFANDGLLNRNYLVKKVSTSTGIILFERPDTEAGRVFSKTLAQEMNTMMQEVVLAGTGRQAILTERQVAGKTGTSQQWRDAWFVGFSAQLVTGVWVGNDDNSPMNRVTGGTLPAQIWQQYMQMAHKGLPNKKLSAAAPQILSATDEGLASFYGELSSIFGQLERDTDNP